MRIVKTSTSDGLKLTGFLSEPENQKKDSIIVHIHGMAGDPYTNAWYPYFHKLFPENGIAFLVGNHRGTGSITMFSREPEKYPNYGDALELFEESVFDIDAWAQCAKNLGYKNICIQSHSFAPSKVVYYLNQGKPDFVNKLVFISPVDMLGLTLSNPKEHKEMLSEAVRLVGEGKGNRLLTRLLDGEYYISAGTYANLFSEDSKANIFCYTDRKHDWSMVNEIDKPVLAIGGTKDMPMEVVSNSENALAVLKKQLIKSPKVKTVIYKGAEHSFEGYEARIVNDVVNFLRG